MQAYMNNQNLNSFTPQFFKSILESISDGVFTVDKEWRITSFNRAAESITGISRKDAMNKFCSEVFKSSMCEIGCALRKTIESGEPIIDIPCYIINSEGNQIPVSVSTAVLKDSQGLVIGGAETFRDLSEIEALRKEIKQEFRAGSFISYSSSMQEIIKMLPLVAKSSSTLLIQGETGTGKEVLARSIHESGPNADEPFIAINCGALPDTLLESELFGYKKGAFTGADHDKPGKFELAGRGTILLDEIGEISPALQVKLLRVLQEKKCEPLGGTESINVPARVLAATNRDLSAMIEDNSFRHDLFYRINVITLDLPPLRDRVEDIIPLCKKFMTKFNLLQKREIKSISPHTEAILTAYEWPGNIRELENIIERAFILCDSDEITLTCLPQQIRDSFQMPEKASYTDKNDLKISEISEHAERAYILSVLKKNSNNKTKSAKELGIHKATLYRKLKKLCIDL